MSYLPPASVRTDNGTSLLVEPAGAGEVGRALVATSPGRAEWRVVGGGAGASAPLWARVYDRYPGQSWADAIAGFQTSNLWGDSPSGYAAGDFPDALVPLGLNRMGLYTATLDVALTGDGSGEFTIELGDSHSTFIAPPAGATRRYSLTSAMAVYGELTAGVFGVELSGDDFQRLTVSLWQEVAGE